MSEEKNARRGFYYRVWGNDTIRTIVMTVVGGVGGWYFARYGVVGLLLWPVIVLNFPLVVPVPPAE